VYARFHAHQKRSGLTPPLWCASANMTDTQCESSIFKERAVRQIKTGSLFSTRLPVLVLPVEPLCAWDSVMGSRLSVKA
jgi:hypothetical protein